MFRTIWVSACRTGGNFVSLFRISFLRCYGVYVGSRPVCRGVRWMRTHPQISKMLNKKSGCQCLIAIFPHLLWLKCYIGVYDTRCYFNVRSKANVSQLNLPQVSWAEVIYYEQLIRIVHYKAKFDSVSFHFWGERSTFLQPLHFICYLRACGSAPCKCVVLQKRRRRGRRKVASALCGPI